MRLNRVISAVHLSLIVHLYVASGAKPVSMYIRMESTGVNYVYVNFYNDMFQRLYNCITDLHTTQCTVHLQFHKEGSPYPTLNNYNVTNVTWNGIVSTAQGFFICHNNLSTTSLQCTRKRGQCGGDCTSFRLSNASVCECGYLMWKYPNETLLFNNKTDSIEYCDKDCAETTTVYSTEQSSYPSVASLPSEQSPNATTSASNTTNIASSGGDKSSNAVPVIVGVVLGVLFIAVIVIVFGFIYRRKKQTKRQVSNKGINSSPTNTIYNGGPAQSNASNIPDVLSALPSSSRGHETNRESEDGYYTINKDFGLNRYENCQNTLSFKVSLRPSEGVLSSRSLNNYTNELRVSPDTLHTNEGGAVNSKMSHAREGDYFTIDNENDDGAKFKPIEGVLSSRGVNKYTNELSFSPHISHIYEGDAVKSETLHAPEEEYFTLETENDFGEDNTPVEEEQTADGGYSVAKDVDIIDEAPVVDVIDVTPPPKNVYSKFRDNDSTDMKNPYDKLLEKHQILNPKKTS